MNNIRTKKNITSTKNNEIYANFQKTQKRNVSLAVICQGNKSDCSIFVIQGWKQTKKNLQSVSKTLTFNGFYYSKIICLEILT